jgi:hypothetical protein
MNGEINDGQSLARKNAGRASDAIKHRFQRILEESNAYDRLKQILATTKNEETFLKAYQLTLDRAFGKPIQEVRPVDNEGNYAPFQIFMPAQVSGQEGKAT